MRFIRSTDHTNTEEAELREGEKMGLCTQGKKDMIASKLWREERLSLWGGNDSDPSFWMRLWQLGVNKVSGQLMVQQRSTEGEHVWLS